MWVASGTTELATFDGQNFSVFKDEQGNTYDKIIFVVGDKDGHIWFGNNNGLWKYNGREVTNMTQP